MNREARDLEQVAEMLRESDFPDARVAGDDVIDIGPAGRGAASPPATVHLPAALTRDYVAMVAREDYAYADDPESIALGSLAVRIVESLITDAGEGYNLVEEVFLRRGRTGKAVLDERRRAAPEGAGWHPPDDGTYDWTAERPTDTTS